MPEPTLIQVFGAGATQDANTITIQKAALIAKGLPSSASNNAEAIVSALTLLWGDYLNETQQGINTDIQITIADSGYPQIVTRNSNQYTQITVNFNFQKPYSGATLNPSEY